MNYLSENKFDDTLSGMHYSTLYAPQEPKLERCRIEKRIEWTSMHGTKTQTFFSFEINATVDEILKISNRLTKSL